jgi:four helix bundle protein
MHAYENLDVWQRGHRWVLDVYQVTQHFPKHEAFGLTSQLRRSAASVPTNLVEGYRRDGDREKVRFLNIAQASLDEASYQLLLAHDLSYGDTSELRNEAEQIARMLAAYARPIRRRIGF